MTGKMKFKEAFAENENTITAPQSWEKYINLTAPEGSYYIKLDNSQYHLVSKDGTVQMKSNITLPEDLKHIEISSPEDFNKLLYNTQRTIEISRPSYLINDQEVEVTTVVKVFGEDIKHEKSKYYLIPRPFNPPFRLPFKFNEHEYSLLMEQIPYPSVKEVVFESIQDNIFHLKINVVEIYDKINISFTYNFSEAKSLSNIIEYEEMISDYAIGPVEIFGNKIEKTNVKEKENLLNVLEFYKKLYAISRFFDLDFDISQSIMQGDFITLQKIYYSFIENNYYYSEETVDDITLNFENNDNSSIEEMKLNNIAIMGYNKVSISLLNQEFNFTEQFVFKKSEFKNERSTEHGSAVTLNILDNKIQYKRLFIDVDPPSDFNDLIPKLDDAKAIEIV